MADICHDSAPTMPGDTGPLFCDRLWDHGGHHETVDPNGWEPGEFPRQHRVRLWNRAGQIVRA